MFPRQDYNDALMCLAVNRTRMDAATMAQTADLDRATQIMRMRQQSLVGLANRNALHLENQFRNTAQLPRFGLSGTNDAITEIIKRNQTIMELEKLKQLLDTFGGDGEDKLWGLLTRPMTSGAVVSKVRPNLQLLNFGGIRTSEPGPSENPTSILSPRSDISSGIGTLTSPTSSSGDWDALSSLATPSPPPVSNTTKPLTIITDDSQKGSDTDEDATPKAEETKERNDINYINYQGRNLLDLHHNMTHQWGFQMAAIPAHDLVTHFQYRSLYHRLGPFGLVDEHVMEQCAHCDFKLVKSTE